MDDFYLQQVELANASDVWKTAPVHFETCGDFNTWQVLGINASCNLEYALGLHCSVLNDKSKSIPTGSAYDAAVTQFNSRAGFRLVLVEASFDAFPLSLEMGANISVSSRWLNTGVAPPYRHFRLAYRLVDSSSSNASGDDIVVSSAVGTSVRHWLPGEHVVSSPADSLAVPSTGTGNPRGFDLQMAIVGPPGDEDGVPRVPMNVVGVDEAGWGSVARVTSHQS